MLPSAPTPGTAATTLPAEKHDKHQTDSNNMSRQRGRQKGQPDAPWHRHKARPHTAKPAAFLWFFIHFHDLARPRNRPRHELGFQSYFAHPGARHGAAKGQ